MGTNHRFIRPLGLLAFAILNAQLSSVFAQLTFTTNTYNAGLGPSSVVVADINGDTKPDLVCANKNDDTLMVLTNNGGGVFGSNVTLNVGSSPACVIAADVNSDGRPDLISANRDSWTLTVLTNEGSGSFGSNSTLNVDDWPLCVVAADVDADGNLDLISADFGSNPIQGKLTVLTNNGSGVFGIKTSPVVGGGAYCVVAADVNSDGKPDLISANYNSQSLSVLTNSGGGVFPYKAMFSAGGVPNWVIAGDVNGDDKLDLVSALYGLFVSPLMVFTNNGSGVFHFKTAPLVGSGAYCVVAADMNADGKLDLISANHGDNTLTVLTNVGSGSFSSNATLNVGSGPASVVAVDINADRKLDLISANDSDNTLTVLINTTEYPPPLLNIAPVADQVALSWPTWSGNYALESIADLTLTNWLAVTNGTLMTNGMPIISVILTNTSPVQFFRLHGF